MEEEKEGEEYILVPRSKLLQLKQDYETYQRLLKQMAEDMKIRK